MNEDECDEETRTINLTLDKEYWGILDSISHYQEESIEDILRELIESTISEEGYYEEVLYDMEQIERAPIGPVARTPIGPIVRDNP